MQAVIQTSGLTKHYRGKAALDDVTFGGRGLLAVPASTEA